MKQRARRSAGGVVYGVVSDNFVKKAAYTVL